MTPRSVLSHNNLRHFLNDANKKCCIPAKCYSHATHVVVFVLYAMIFMIYDAANSIQHSHIINQITNAPPSL